MTNEPTTSTQPAKAQGVPTTALVKDIFSTIAPGYDLANRLNSLGLDTGWRREAIRMAEITEGSEVLDLAAGTGDLTVAVARQTAAKRVVACDMVPAMLERARAKVAALEGPTRFEFEVADVQKLPFAEGVFDAATIAFGVRNLTDRAAHFREVLRVLKPGGRYVVLEATAPRNPALRAGFRLYMNSVVLFWGWLLTRDLASYRYLGASIERFPQPPALAQELEAAGFADVRWRSLSFGLVSVHVGRKPAA